MHASGRLKTNELFEKSKTGPECIRSLKIQVPNSNQEEQFHSPRKSTFEFSPLSIGNAGSLDMRVQFQLLRFSTRQMDKTRTDKCYVVRC
jgi:hypothetical protein